MKEIIHATQTTLSKRAYLLTFLSLTPLAFLIFIFLQVSTIPGNSFSLQFKVLTLSNYLLMGIVSVLVSLLITMQAFIFRNAYLAHTKLTSVGIGEAVGCLGVFAAIVGTATCASCLFALFGFLGFGSIVFLLKNQTYIVSLSIVLLLASLYFSSRKVNGVCQSCRINKKSIK